MNHYAWKMRALNVFHMKWIIETYGNWRNQNPGGRFGATSYLTSVTKNLSHVCYSIQNCDLTNFCILGDFVRKMANISDFKKMSHFICLILNQICFTSLFAAAKSLFVSRLNFEQEMSKLRLLIIWWKLDLKIPDFCFFQTQFVQKVKHRHELWG